MHARMDAWKRRLGPPAEVRAWTSFPRKLPPPPNHSPTALSRTGNHPQNCIGTVQNPSTTLTSSSLL
ncbi:hyp [Burkholderia pseudomallei 305]|nr:hyp [Burkholderia pseudomallei 305]